MPVSHWHFSMHVHVVGLSSEFDPVGSPSYRLASSSAELRSHRMFMIDGLSSEVDPGDSPSCRMRFRRE